MRILRGKSNLEVSSQGFAWFVVGLVLATFLGGAVRTLLSSERVHQRIVAELKGRLPNHEFRIQQTKVLLSHGIWPGLGLRLRGVHFRQETCGKLSFTLDVPEAILPVDLIALWHGQFRLGRLRMDQGNIDFSYKPCAAATVEASAGAEKIAKPKLPTYSLDSRRLEKYLDAIDLRDFNLTYEGEPTWKATIRTLDVELVDELAGQGVIEIQKSLPFGSIVHKIDLEAQGEDHYLNWTLHSEYKEGQIALKGNLDLNGGLAKIEVRARELPLKEFLAELHQIGALDRQVNLKTTWLSCALNWEGRPSEVEGAPLRVRDCKVEGAYGRVEVAEAEIWPWLKEKFKKPARVSVERLQIQPMLEALGRQVLPAVLAKPGLWSGSLDFSGARSWQIDGKLEGAEVVFSNRSVRGKQVVESVRTQVSQSEGNINARLEGFALQSGALEGQVEMRMNQDFRSGTFRVDIGKLLLNPAIQYLLTGGTIGAVRLVGEGSLQAGELALWKGSFQLPEISGAGWKIADIQIGSRFQGAFMVDAKADQLTVTEAWPAFPQLAQLPPAREAPLVWRAISAQAELSSSGGAIHAATAKEVAGNIIWRLKGTWVRDGELNGQLGLAGKTYGVRGEKGKVAIEVAR